MKKYLEYKDQKSHKFWQIEVKSNSFTVFYGKVDTNGQSKTKEFESDEIATSEAEKIIKQKLKKGYKEVNDSSKTEMNQESKDYAIKLLKEEILFGFYTKEDMLQSIGDAFYGEDDYDEKWLENEISIHLKKHKEYSLSWQTPTDFDRLVKAFDQLSEQKIVALHRAGYTKQDARDDCMEVLDKLKRKGIQVKGYCYYHTQDLERAIGEEKMLFIGFESYNCEDNLAKEIAKKIVEILKQNSFEVKWNGKLEKRIEIHNLNWKKTVDNVNYGYKRIKKIMKNNSIKKLPKTENVHSQLAKTENTTLFYKQERSDKIYKASLEEKEGHFIVNFAYGRRGSTLKTGTKTQAPVPYEKAKKIYDKLVLSKASKGYVPDEDNTSAYVVDLEQRKTGIHCQLLNPIEEVEVKELFENDDWWLQEKKDGRRMLIQKNEKETIAINRKGLSVGAPEKMIVSANAIDSTFIIDGEAIDDDLFVFDILSFNGKDIKDKSYDERYEILKNMNFKNEIKLVSTAKTSEEKQTLYNKLKQENSEGVVFKKHQSTYQAGRPNSGGTQVKFKFYDTCSVIVSKINDKRSVGMSVLEKGKEVFVGNVTISINKEIPKKDDIIEVRYLYAYKGGSLYQPTFLSVRNDIEKKDCVIEQLKYKQE